MIIQVYPAKSLAGVVSLPSSKSYSIRAAIIAACGGQSLIQNFSECDDAQIAIKVASQLGAEVKKLSSHSWKLKSKGIFPKRRIIFVGESGTVLRFLLPILAFQEGLNIRIVGKGTLRGRPNHHLTNLLRDLGVEVRGAGPHDSIPITIKGKLPLKNNFSINGSISSQFISALLIAGCLLRKKSHILITGRQPVSLPYIVMTTHILKRAGAVVIKKSQRHYEVKGNRVLKGLGKFEVPSDYGLAAFLLGAGALAPSSLVLKGPLTRCLIQADTAIVDILQKMGGRFDVGQKTIKIKGPQILKGGKFSLKDCPDLVPIITVLALFAKGKTHLCDIGHVRIKESDRIGDLARELQKVGAKVIAGENSLKIFPRLQYVSNAVLDPHGDHRLAMAFCVLGLKIGTRVKDIECIRKSYPAFLKDLRKIGVKLRRI